MYRVINVRPAIIFEGLSLQSERDDMGESGGGRPDLTDRLEYMSDLISQLERLAREQGLSKLASLLQEAHEEAARRRNGKDS
jgi:hypothetical protein